MIITPAPALSMSCIACMMGWVVGWLCSGWWCAMIDSAVVAPKKRQFVYREMTLSINIDPISLRHIDGDLRTNTHTEREREE